MLRTNKQQFGQRFQAALSIDTVWLWYYEYENTKTLQILSKRKAFILTFTNDNKISIIALRGRLCDSKSIQIHNK